MMWQRCSEHVERTGGRIERLTRVTRVHHHDNVEIIGRWLEGNVRNVQAVGGDGMHRYNNQDHSIPGRGGRDALVLPAHHGRQPRKVS